ncbi:MAG: pilus assembly protein TadG-related protein, partial [Acetobacteraceae bacterium]
MVRYRSIARAWNVRRQCTAPSNRRHQRISRDRQASVSVIAALALPVCLGVMGLGIDVSQWAMVRQRLQGIADLAALAGAGRYAYTLDSTQALSAASGVAEVNGLPVGAASAPTSGYSATFAFSSSPPRVSVTIQRQVSLSFARLLTSATTQAVSATAVAQVFQRANGSQACVLGLQGFSNHQTSGTDLTFNGNTDTNMAGCDLRSDAGITFNGNFSADVPQIIASGTITANGSKLSCPTGGDCDAQLTGMPQIPDPFAGSYGSLLDAIPSGSSSLNFNGNGTASYSPGSYQSISFNGNGSV